MNQFQYKFDVFEGPLDLLLLLIEKNKLNIYDISIAELLEQYMAQMNLMEQNDMEISSEFLEMAARLIHIKSQMLLPKENENNLKNELENQLIEYRIYKNIAIGFRNTYSFDSIVKIPEPIPFDRTYHRLHEKEDLVSAYISAVGKGKRYAPPPKSKFDGIVKNKVVSITSQIVYILRTVWKEGKTSYRKLFNTRKDRSEKVAAFLALLELVKGKRVKLIGDSRDYTIKLVTGDDKTGSE
jgi:segregation and condensation protein A